MAKIIINEKEYDVKDGEPIAEVCEDAGIPFSCNSGICGSCQINIVEGADSLNALQEEEIDLGLDQNTRLGCLCAVNSGKVKISY